MDHKDLREARSVTLNSLLEEQRSLNMRMLLAIQLRDLDAQAELRSGLEDVAARIEGMLSGNFHHQGLPQ